MDSGRSVGVVNRVEVLVAIGSFRLDNGTLLPSSTDLTAVAAGARSASGVSRNRNNGLGFLTEFAMRAEARRLESG
jgi:hypothetical protein